MDRPRSKETRTTVNMRISMMTEQWNFGQVDVANSSHQKPGYIMPTHNSTTTGATGCQLTSN